VRLDHLLSRETCLGRVLRDEPDGYPRSNFRTFGSVRYSSLILGPSHGPPFIGVFSPAGRGAATRRLSGEGGPGDIVALGTNSSMTLSSWACSSVG
jgi:hypothetical protein